MQSNTIKTFGSVCSGIEAASFVLKPLGGIPLWLSEIEDFASRFLAAKYPEVPNLGDMNYIPQLLRNGNAEAPDLLCGGTPCQAFSLAGWKNGLDDNRGQLTLKYIDILDEIDAMRERQGKLRARFFWKNVEGVLTDKTNAFGCFLAGLAGYDEPLTVAKWGNSGILHGKKRNIAWRVLDAKYFGLPQQRRRIYVVGGGKDFYPENILFDCGDITADPYCRKECSGMFDTAKHCSVPTELTRDIRGVKIEIFRTYTDCLYAAYGTKWNGNAAAFNGSLFVSQDGKLRRLTPVECERLMGFPDNYTNLDKATFTNRFRAAGNSWAVNVVKWIMERLICKDADNPRWQAKEGLTLLKDFIYVGGDGYRNATAYPIDYKLSNFLDLVDINPAMKLYISKAGCAGILRRKNERNANMNCRLERVLQANA